MCHHGNISSVKIGTYDEVELTNGTQGMKRIDLVVNRYTRNEEDNTEKNEWVVIMGTPAESNPAVPEYIKGNLQNGDLVDDCPVFEVHFDGINIVEVTKKLEIAQTNKDLVDRSTCLPRTYKSQNFSDKVATGVVTPLKYTVPEDGYYFVSFKLEDMTNIESGYKLAYTSCPRTGWICAQSTGSCTTTDRFNASNIVYLKASDVVTLYYNHNSGGTVSINAVLICARLA